MLYLHTALVLGKTSNCFIYHNIMKNRPQLDNKTKILQQFTMGLGDIRKPLSRPTVRVVTIMCVVVGLSNVAVIHIRL